MILFFLKQKTLQKMNETEFHLDTQSDSRFL